MTPSLSAKSKARPASSVRPSRTPAPARKPSARARPPPKPPAKPTAKAAPAAALAPVPEIRRPDGRRHLLSLAFVRDGDEFMARIETDSGHITELKNRALDHLLTLVAGELEDLLE